MSSGAMLMLSCILLEQKVDLLFLNTLGVELFYQGESLQTQSNFHHGFIRDNGVDDMWNIIYRDKIGMQRLLGIGGILQYCVTQQKKNYLNASMQALAIKKIKLNVSAKIIRKQYHRYNLTTVFTTAILNATWHMTRGSVPNLKFEVQIFYIFKVRTQICRLSLWYNKHMLHISVVFLWSCKGLTEVALLSHVFSFVVTRGWPWCHICLCYVSRL